MNDLCYVVRIKCAPETRDRCGAADERIRLGLLAYAELSAAFYTEGPRPAVTVEQMLKFNARISGAIVMPPKGGG